LGFSTLGATRHRRQSTLALTAVSPQHAARCTAHVLVNRRSSTAQVRSAYFPYGACTAAAVVQVLSSDSWAAIKDLLRHGDRNGASAEVDVALAKIDAKSVSRLDGRTKEDVRYQVLALAGLDERLLLTAVLGMQSAETCGPEPREADLGTGSSKRCPRPSYGSPRDHHRRQVLIAPGLETAPFIRARAATQTVAALRPKSKMCAWNCRAAAGGLNTTEVRE
jgi:hypothetical protein